MKKVLVAFLAASLIFWTMSCASMSRTQKGGAIGAAGGAVVGGLIGKAAGSTIIGAIIGAAVGGAAGAYIGNYMDKQAAEMRRDLEGAKVERIGEGIKITFDSGLLFDVDKAALRDTSQVNLQDLARILNKYPDTNILIEGHTDSTGADDYNLALSKRRAESVWPNWRSRPTGSRSWATARNSRSLPTIRRKAGSRTGASTLRSWPTTN
jgi:outer membrane protein OmpA-like peptidoglycan-associated protein